MKTKIWGASIQRLTSSALCSSHLLRLGVGLLILIILVSTITLVFIPSRSSPKQLAQFQLPYVQKFEDVDLTNWLAQNGKWLIRDETLIQLTNPDKISWIYIPLQLDKDQLYHLSTHITLATSAQAAGINFNAQYPMLITQMHQVYIIRKVAKGNADEEKANLELVAGYTDETGKFIRQVSVPIAVDTHNYWLDLYVTDNMYTVQLNGTTLIERRPLFYPSGLIGFYSSGRVTFDTFTIVPVCSGRKSGNATPSPGCT